MRIAFYTGPQCSLCHDAEAIIAQSEQADTLTVTQYNIREDSELYHLYAVRIPVLKREDNGQELGWPFNLEELELFLK
ncbi:glutaredoxin family protein [Alteromonas gilva]|uniref:Glutaredoxin family protein n=1 Tax=Alteromonas gilva TaxID=2987522 RepID=A0ABT5L3S1_9ALTE|nr:glutaredoxin family protein [Alteromonas gilva]MDC8831051.1 glutaredoxin family protein [Alteromonas gilva]